MTPLLLLGCVAYFIVPPFRKLRLGVFPTERIGHLALNPDLFSRRSWLRQAQGKVDHTRVFFIAGNPANEQLLSMWARTLPVIRAPFLHAVLRSTQSLWSKTPFYEPLDMQSNEYEEYHAAPPTLRFTAQEEAEGRRQLAAWGIDLDRDWFACVFARDNKYLNTVYADAGDWSYHDFRNADIDSFNPAIQEIVDRGGFVIRMGFHVDKPLSIHSDRVIDYASRYRSDFMDIFIPAKCRFFLGTGAGITDVAMIFDRPRLAVDWAPFGSATWGKDDLVVPKLLVDASTGAQIPFWKLLMEFATRSDPKLWDGRLALKCGYRYIDNTPEEIRAATREMLDRLDRRFIPTDEDRALQERYFNLFPAHHWSAKVKTPVPAAFLKMHRDLLTV